MLALTWRRKKSPLNGTRGVRMGFASVILLNRLHWRVAGVAVGRRAVCDWRKTAQIADRQAFFVCSVCVCVKKLQANDENYGNNHENPYQL